MTTQTAVNRYTRHQSLLHGVDWKLLREQKQWLAQFENDYAVGLECLIEALQDEAIATGVAPAQTVYGLTT
jgi:hypothetical protein